MVDVKELTQVIENYLQGGDYFLVDVQVTKDNDITVEIDAAEGVDIDYCIALTHEIEAHFDRDVEDYQLEVGSAGLTSPLKVTKQYLKNIGNTMEVLTRSGEKMNGVLLAADDATCSLEVERMEKPEGAKRKVKVKHTIVLDRKNIKYIKQLITFK